MTPHVPSGFVLSIKCPAQSGALDVVTGPKPQILGSSEKTNTGLLVDKSCVANPYHLSARIEQGDAFVFSNNIPLAKIDTTNALTAIKTATDQNGGNLEPSNEILYTITVTNSKAVDIVIDLTDAIPANTSYKSNSVSVAGTVNNTNPIEISAITVPASGQVIISFSVIVDAVLANGTTISNQATITYDSTGDGNNDISLLTDGDTIQLGNNPTTLDITSGANFSTSSKSVNLQIDIDNNGVVSVGDVLRYTVVISNTGNANETGVAFTDTLATNVQFISGTATDGGAVTPNWIGDVNANAQVTLIIDVLVKSGSLGATIANSALVTFSTGSENTDGNNSLPGAQSTDVVLGGSIEGVAIMSVVDVNGGNVEPTDELRYRISLKNQSNLNAVNLVYVNAIPANTTYKAGSAVIPSGSIDSTSPTLRITGISVPAKSQVNLTYSVIVNTPLASGVTQISNQGTINFDTTGDGNNNSSQATDGDTTKSGNQATIIEVTAGANFSTTSKSVTLQNDLDGNGIVSPADVLRYTIVISNTGNANSTGVTFQDNTPANTTFVTNSASASSGTLNGANPIDWTGDINGGKAVTITFDVTVNAGINTGTTISNSGIVGYDTTNNGTNDSTVLTDGDSAAPGKQTTDVIVGSFAEGLAIKSVTDVNGGNVEAGDELHYVIAIQNESGINAVGLELVDTIPANTTYKLNSVIIPTGATTVTTSPILRITGIDVPANSQVSVEFSVLVNSPLAAGVGEISNQATINFDSTGDGNNDSSQQTDGDTTLLGEQATIIAVNSGANFENLSKTVTLQTDADNNGAVSPNDTLRYQIEITNSGTQASNGVTLTDIIPTNTTFVNASETATSGNISFNAGNNQIEWTDNMAVSGTAVITFDVTVNAGLSLGTTISNTGVLSYDADNNGSNETEITTDGSSSLPGNQATEVNIGGSPQGLAVITITDANGNGFANAGEVLTYSVTLTNQSTLPATGIVFTNPIPANTNTLNITAIPTAAVNASTVDTVVINNINMAAGSSVNIVFSITVINPLDFGITQISTQGTVSFDSDGNGSNDSTQLTDGDLTQAGLQVLVILIDSDGDGIADTTDPDDDNDNILDSNEGNGTIDTDNDGIPDSYDTDSDGDGISDLIEGNIDTDNDNIPDFQDTDSDNDLVPDSVEGTADSDGDNIINATDYDPSGYFYDEATGQIISGGLIAVNCTIGTITFVNNFNGSNGFYQFLIAGLTNTPSFCTMTPTIPTGFKLSTNCPVQTGTLDVISGPNPQILGSGENASTGVLVNRSCAANPYYLSANIEQGDAFVFNNNIPLARNNIGFPSATPVPTLSWWMLLLSVFGLWIVLFKTIDV